MAKKKTARKGGGRAARARTASKGSAKQAKRSAKAAKASRTAKRSTSAKTATTRKTTKPAKKATPGKTTKTPRTLPATPLKRASSSRAAKKPAADPTARRAPSLDRERRTVSDDIVPTPPSSLDLDRRASAARSGRRELVDKLQEHTSTGPAMTGGDIDADWESAEAVGDEAPGGDNPTPDQDVVDEIGKALGVEYDDDEELRGGDEIVERDRNRWELDPASKEDLGDE